MESIIRPYEIKTLLDFQMLHYRDSVQELVGSTNEVL